MRTVDWVRQQLADGKAWKAKMGKYIHDRGCDCNASMQCLCEFPYPIPKEILDEPEICKCANS